MGAEWQKDRVESKDVRKWKAAERYAHNISKKAKHAAKRDHAEEILCTALHIRCRARNTVAGSA
jgi:hypothetical protein